MSADHGCIQFFTSKTTCNKLNSPTNSSQIVLMRSRLICVVLCTVLMVADGGQSHFVLLTALLVLRPNVDDAVSVTQVFVLRVERVCIMKT